MDSNALIRIEDTVNQIKSSLLLNEDIRKLLYYESDEMDNETVPSIQLVEGNIFTQPIVSIDTNPPFNKKVFIAISNPMIVPNDVSATSSIKISVMADKTMWIYQKNKNRILRLAQHILNEIDSKKFACSNPLNFAQMLETNLDNTICGKTLLFSIVDGVGD